VSGMSTVKCGLVLVSTSPHRTAAEIRSTYELRRPSKSGTGSTSASGSYRMHSCAFSLVVNQVLFVLIAYTLVQAHLVLRRRQELTCGVWERTWQLLSPALEVVAVYYRQRFCLLPLANTAHPAGGCRAVRAKRRDRLRQIERDQYSLLENARPP